MASDQPVCRACGKALAGRDRFERLCPACREAEVLRQPLPQPTEAAAEEVLDCPACGGANAPGAAACTHCGAPLRGRGPIGMRLLLAAGVLVLAAGVAWLAFLRPRDPTRPSGRQAAPAPKPEPTPGLPEPAPSPAPVAAKPAPPDVAAAIQQETREFLGFLALGNYDRIIDNYVQPDELDFARGARALDDLVSGSGAKGAAEWGARRIRLRLSEAAMAAELKRAGDPEPAYTVALLAFLAREPAASDPTKSSEDRARAVLRWHLASLFEGLEAASAEPGAVGEARPGQLAIALPCRGQRKASWLRNEPAQLVWHRLPVGWVVKLGLADRLERTRDLLKRPPPDGRPTPPGAVP